MKSRYYVLAFAVAWLLTAGCGGKSDPDETAAPPGEIEVGLPRPPRLSLEAAAENAAEGEVVHVGKCLVERTCRRNAGGEGRDLSELYVVDLATGEVQPVTSEENVSLYAAAANAEWNTFVAVGVDVGDTDQDRSVIVYRAGEGRERAFSIREGTDTYKDFSVVYDDGEGVFYVAYARDEYGRSPTSRTTFYRYDPAKKTLDRYADGDYLAAVVGASPTGLYVTYRADPDDFLGSKVFGYIDKGTKTLSRLPFEPPRAPHADDGGIGPKWQWHTYAVPYPRDGSRDDPLYYYYDEFPPDQEKGHLHVYAASEETSGEYDHANIDAPSSCWYWIPDGYEWRLLFSARYGALVYIDDIYDETSGYRISAVPSVGTGALRYYVTADSERGSWSVQRYELLYVE
jgi:hypothetical protein